MSTTIWLMLEMFGIFAVAAYAAFPDAPDIGAMFTTVFNAGMTGIHVVPGDRVLELRQTRPLLLRGRRMDRLYSSARPCALGHRGDRPLRLGRRPANGHRGRAHPGKRQVVFIQLVWVDHREKDGADSSTSKSIQTLLASTTSMTFPTTPRASAAPLCRTTHGSFRNSSCFPTVKPKCLRCTRSA